MGSGKQNNIVYKSENMGIILTECNCVTLFSAGLWN